MYNADSVVESAVDVAFPNNRRKGKYLSYFMSFEIADLVVTSCYSIELSFTSQLRWLETVSSTFQDLEFDGSL